LVSRQCLLAALAHEEAGIRMLGVGKGRGGGGGKNTGRAREEVGGGRTELGGRWCGGGGEVEDPDNSSAQAEKLPAGRKACNMKTGAALSSARDERRETS